MKFFNCSGHMINLDAVTAAAIAWNYDFFTLPCLKISLSSGESIEVTASQDIADLCKEIGAQDLAIELQLNRDQRNREIQRWCEEYEEMRRNRWWKRLWRRSNDSN